MREIQAIIFGSLSIYLTEKRNTDAVVDSFSCTAEREFVKGRL